MVYAPAEDSYLLSKSIESLLKSLSSKDKKNLKVLDMGSGSGIQAKTCIKNQVPKKNILCVDLSEQAIDYLKKQKLQTIHSNLFEKIKKDEKFDLILFNPPYLPEHKYDKQIDTTGGKKGHETIILFLKQAKQHIK